MISVPVAASRFSKTRGCPFASGWAGSPAPARLSGAAARLLRAAPPIEQRLPCAVAFHILADLQLALRHPGTAGTESGRLVRVAAEQLGEALGRRVPALRALIAAGWDPAQDA